MAEGEARRVIAELARTTGPEFAAFREAAALLEAKLAVRRGDEAAIDRLVARFSRTSEKPMLICSPPLDELSQAGSPAPVGGATGAVSTSAFEDQWIDGGFWSRRTGA